MCLSFIHRGKDTIIAMNFDNNGMEYKINTADPDRFVVLVDGGRGKYPSFGINNLGVFVNNLMVDSNGKGLYRRPSKKVTHTSKLVNDILYGAIASDNIEEYLSNIEVVNTPDWSTHNMICDHKANAWVVEPGRGNIYNPVSESSYFVMSNFSLWDQRINNVDTECLRYKRASSELKKHTELSIEEAFEIIEAVKQENGEWVTGLSLVYSKNRNEVYYCVNRNFDDVHKYTF